MINFEKGWIGLAENLPLRDSSEIHVVLSHQDARRAADLLSAGFLSEMQARTWAIAVLRRRDVDLEESWSIDLFQFLEEWAFGVSPFENVESWLQQLDGERALRAEASLAMDRGGLVQQVIASDEFAMRAIELLSQQESAGVGDATLVLKPDDVIRAIELVLDGKNPLGNLRIWSRFVLGWRDIGYGSLIESWTLGNVLVDCASLIPESELRATLVAELSIVGALVDRLRTQSPE